MAGLMTSTPIGSYGIQACMGSSTGSALSGQIQGHSYVGILSGQGQLELQV